VIALADVLHDVLDDLIAAARDALESGAELVTPLGRYADDAAVVVAEGTLDGSRPLGQQGDILQIAHLQELPLGMERLKIGVGRERAGQLVDTRIVPSNASERNQRRALYLWLQAEKKIGKGLDKPADGTDK